MILRTILHKYLIDDVLPAEHVQDWVDWTQEASEHFWVDHNPDTGEHSTLTIPVAAAVVSRVQDVGGKTNWLVRTSYGFADKGIKVDDTGSIGKIVFTMPDNVSFWQGRFTARWKFPHHPNASPTLSPAVIRDSADRTGRTGIVWLHAAADKELADANGFYPTYGGTLVVIGSKD